MRSQYKIVLIGAGNVATHLGKQFIKSGHHILQVYSRTEASAQILSKKLKCPFTTDIKKVTKGADLYILAIKDDALEQVAKNISFNNNSLLVHLSGSTSMNVLKKASDNYGVFYPVQTFSKNKTISFKNIPLCIEANNQTSEKILFALATSISNKVYEVDSKKRKILHLAAVFASNFSNHMYHIAENILQKEQLDLDILKPLISETAAKIKTQSPRIMQTGPAIREDKKIISEHIELLKDNKDFQEIYKLLTENIIKNKNK